MAAAAAVCSASSVRAARAARAAGAVVSSVPPASLVLPSGLSRPSLELSSTSEETWIACVCEAVEVGRAAGPVFWTGRCPAW